MSTKSVSTKKPTGLTISRDGGNFTFAWKIGDSDYGEGQWYECIVDNGRAGSGGQIGGSVTSLTLALGAIRTVTFSVKGKRKNYKKKKNGKETTYNPKTSDVASCTWTAVVPPAPSLSYSRTSSNAGTFTWSLTVSNTDAYVFSHVEFQTCTSRGNDVPGTGWSVSSVSSSGSQSYTETLGGSNLVRWVRVRSVGAAGASGWSYAYHAYGNPSTPYMLRASGSGTGTATRIMANWNAPFSLSHPIDAINIQYAIDVPESASLSAPSTGWSDAGGDVSPNGGADIVYTNISDGLSADECMWVRVRAKHDDSYTYSNAVIAMIGTLVTPGISASPNTTTGDVAITITENTSCDVAGTVVFYRSEKRPNYDQVVAVLANGVTTCTVHIDEIMTSYEGHVDTTCFGAWAYVGSHNGLSVSAVMRSGTATDSDILARPPAWLELSDSGRDKCVRIKWPWSWSAATSAELAWADHDDAWESTDGPSTYAIDDKQVLSWVIANLETGKRWFFRVRLKLEDGMDNITGPWSEIYDYDLSSIPDKPVLTLSKEVINDKESVTARWAYVSTDNTTQSFADICLATISSGVITYGNVIAHVGESQTVEISRDWTANTTYYLCLRQTSSAGRQTEWSDPVPLFVAPEISIELTGTSGIVARGEIATYQYTDGVPEPGLSWSGNLSLTSELIINGGKSVVTEGTIESGNYKLEVWRVTGEVKIINMPLGFTITGAGNTGTTIVSIVRAEDYQIYRPDDSDISGYAGENIVSKSITGEGTVTISYSDLVGYLDDGARYKVICTVIDEYGQTDSLEFGCLVAWTHQAGIPAATVEIDKWQRIAIITPTIPQSAFAAGDVCDIYRISADKPELIVKGATFGETYVDPYPAFGDFCGHRIVTRTANGDYITATNELAWFMCDSDVGDLIEEDAMIIDVQGEQIELPYNISLQNSWTKDFKRTNYLGGSVKGDWNPAVTRDLTAGTVIVRGDDIDRQISMRNLAGYAGIAHIRTPDGSSVAADIQVRETMSYDSATVTYSLAIKVIDSDQLEGLTLDEWQEMNPVG